jgi:nucleoside-diphosphate-sugar epimerase
MVYLITGGAGFLGINLVRYLLKQGHKIRSFDIAPFDYPEKREVEAIQGDIRDPQAVGQAVRGADIVVHCAAALPLYAREEIFSTEIEGTRVLLESALAQGIDRFIYISSTAVYGVPDHHPIRETDSLHGVGAYGEAKIGAEKLCQEFRSKGLCVPIVRPKTFVGPERLGVFELLYSWAYEGRNFPMIGSGANRYQLLDVEDLSQAIYLCATRDKTLVDDEFNVGAQNFETMRQDFQAVLDRAGHGKRVIGFPAWPAIQLLKLLKMLHVSPLYRWVYETMPMESFVSIDRIATRLGFLPQYSNSEALVRNYEWYVLNRNQFEGSSGVSHRVPWKHGILRFVRYLF